MKGLLLKDFYMIIKYCRVFALIVIIFLVSSIFSDNNAFFIIYPILMASIIPVTLISYDEREKWNVYSGTLPYSKAQIVSSTYLVGLILDAIVIVAVIITQLIRMVYTSSFNISELFILLQSIITIGLIVPSFILPFIFKLGAEKGRIVYFIVIFAVCAFSASVFNNSFLAKINDTHLSFYIVFTIIAIIYVLSWLMSIAFYKKREI